MYRIILRFAYDRRGQRLHGQFEAWLAGRCICVSRQPLLDAARVLFAEGVDPAETIAMRHADADFDAMTASIGEAEKWTVQENETQSPTFRRWEAFPGRRVQPLVRYSGGPAPDTGHGAERIHESHAG